jgi:hypothetical protein
MSEPEEEPKGFKVTDRRKFTSEGDPRPDVPSEKPAPVVEPKKTERVVSEARRKAPAAAGPEGQGGELAGDEFLQLVSWLATNAFMQLGEIADPVSGTKLENLAGAQEFIGILTMLKEKTRGNLSGEESRALDQVLYELRMRFVAKAGHFKT